MFHYVFGLFLFIGSLVLATAQDDVGSALARAEALYYEARFSDSIGILLPLDFALRSHPDRLQERVHVKLQLALAYVGLNEIDEAFGHFAELSDLDPDYILDPRRFSEKVISLFEEAKAERNRGKCRTFCSEAGRLLDIEDAQGLLAHIESAARDCTCVQATAMDAADHFYQQGFNAYKQEDFLKALENFRLAVEFRPEHELAASYIELTRDKQRLAADRLFLEWHTKFEAREFGLAAAAYYRLLTADVEGSAAHAIEEARAQYRLSLSILVEAWNQACARADHVTMESVRTQTADMLPDPAIGEDLLAQIKICENRECLQIRDELAMVRLKTRVAPRIPSSFRRGSVTVRVKTKIDEEGNVTVIATSGGNAAVRDAVQTAVENWKFEPATVGNEIRCVETEIPIVISR